MRPLIAPVLAMLLIGCQARAELAVDNAWIRLPAVPGRPAAAYLTVRGGSAKATLLAVSTPAALRAELHESMTGHHGMAGMTPVKQIDVAPGTTVALAPGGKHVMLFDVSPALKAGETARVTLKFAEGQSLTTDAKVIGAADPAP